jgi:hypothetical protein
MMVVQLLDEDEVMALGNRGNKKARQGVLF